MGVRGGCLERQVGAEGTGRDWAFDHANRVQIQTGPARVNGVFRVGQENAMI